jgi:hypothetical protein
MTLYNKQIVFPTIRINLTLKIKKMILKIINLFSNNLNFLLVECIIEVPNYRN